MRNLSYENEFCMQFDFHANQSHFHKNGFALRLALKQRHKGTRKWPIDFQSVVRGPTKSESMLFVTKPIPYLSGFFTFFFPTVSLMFTVTEMFHQVISERTTERKPLATGKLSKMLHGSSCEML